MDIVLICDDLPREDGFAFVHEEQLLPGGSCANVLVALANLGTSTALLAKMGDDHYGQSFLADLEASGVSNRYVQMKKNGISLHTFITVARNGSKAIFSHMGDSLLDLSEEEIDLDVLEGVRVFYTDLVPGKPALKLARICRERSIPVVFNLQVGPAFMELCRTSRGEIDEMLSICDLFITNHNFILELAIKGECIEAAYYLFNIYHPPVGIITTRGDKGSVWVCGVESLIVPALNVQATDTTGAGDSFTGGLIHAKFIKGLEMKESIEFATGCAALKCTQRGPRLNASEADIRNFVKKFKEYQQKDE